MTDPSHDTRGHRSRFGRQFSSPAGPVSKDNPLAVTPHESAQLAQQCKMLLQNYKSPLQRYVELDEAHEPMRLARWALDRENDSQHLKVADGLAQIDPGAGQLRGEQASDNGLGKKHPRVPGQAMPEESRSSVSTECAQERQRKTKEAEEQARKNRSPEERAAGMGVPVSVACMHGARRLIVPFRPER